MAIHSVSICKSETLSNVCNLLIYPLRLCMDVFRATDAIMHVFTVLASLLSAILIFKH